MVVSVVDVSILERILLTKVKMNREKKRARSKKKKCTYNGNEGKMCHNFVVGRFFFVKKLFFVIVLFCISTSQVEILYSLRFKIQ